MTNLENRELTIDELDVVAGGKAKDGTPKDILINRPSPPIYPDKIV